MSHFNEIRALSDLADVYADFAHNLYKTANPISQQKLRNCTATILEYRTVEGKLVYVLKSYNTIVAMVDEYGDGIDFLRYVYGYTATSAQHIRKFFDDYCREGADIFIYRP